MLERQDEKNAREEPSDVREPGCSPGTCRHAVPNLQANPYQQ